MGIGQTPTLGDKPYQATYQHADICRPSSYVGARTEKTVAVKLGETRTSVVIIKDGYLSLHDVFSSKHDGKLYLMIDIASVGQYIAMPRGGDGAMYPVRPETYLSLWRNTNVKAPAATVKDTAEKLLNGSILLLVHRFQ